MIYCDFDTLNVSQPQLVRQLHRADIRSVITLMSKVIGDRNAAIMFLRLLYWLPKSRKAGGWWLGLQVLAGPGS